MRLSANLLMLTSVINLVCMQPQHATSKQGLLGMMQLCLQSKGAASAETSLGGVQFILMPPEPASAASSPCRCAPGIRASAAAPALAGLAAPSASSPPAHAAPGRAHTSPSPAQPLSMSQAYEPSPDRHILAPSPLGAVLLCDSSTAACWREETAYSRGLV